jgi:D-psicose/D-tagatose/L-ribulose 3-epimerase
VRYGIITLTWCSPFTTARLDLFKRIASLGYDSVEIFLENEGDLDYQRAREELARVGLAVSVCVQINTARDVSHADREVRRDGVRYLRHCVDAVAGMGGSLVGGPLYGDQIFYGGAAASLRDLSEARALRRRAVDSLREVAEYAGERDVRLAIEPLNRFETSLLCLADQAGELVDEIGSAAVGVQLDTYHMNIEEADLAAAVRATGSHLVHFHANENHRGLPGTGHIPWTDVGTALRDVSYAGAIVAEPFRRAPAELGQSLALWRPPADEAAEDKAAGEALRFLKERLA